jgi:hypothetical protein
MLGTVSEDADLFAWNGHGTASEFLVELRDEFRQF